MLASEYSGPKKLEFELSFAKWKNRYKRRLLRLRRLSGQMLRLMVSWVGFIKRKMDGRKEWLLYQANLFKKKHAYQGYWTRLREGFFSFATPQPKTVIEIFAAIVLYHWIFQLFDFDLPLIPVSEDVSYSYLGTLWSVQIGITAVLVPVTIFIIGLARDERESATRTSAVLIRESWIVPIVTFSILITVYFSWYYGLGSVNESGLIYLLLLVSLGAFLAIFLYYRVIHLFLNTFELRLKSIDLLKEKMTRTIEEAIHTRVGNNILLNSLGPDKIQMDYRYFPVSRHDKLCFVESPKLGYIEDIHVGRLKALSIILENEGRKKGWSFGKNVVTSGDMETVSASPTTELTQSAATPRELKEDKERLLLKRLHDRLDEERRELICFRRDRVDESALGKLEKLALSAFKIREDETSRSATFVRELSYLKDNTLRAIDEQRTGDVDSNLEIYRSLVAVFLNTLENYKANYSFEAAQKELSSFGGWAEIEWIESGLAEFVDRGFASENKTVIRKVMYFPISLAAAAMRHLDYFIFQKFINYAPHFFTLATKMDSELKEYVVSHCWLHLRDFIELSIESKLREEPLSEQLLSRLEEFAVGLILTYNQLLKKACDCRDLDNFKLFESKLNSLFRLFSPSKTYPNWEQLKRQLERGNLTQEQKQEAESKLIYQRKLEAVENSIHLRRKQVWLGLGGWIVRNYLEDKLDEETFNELYSAITAIDDLNELTQLFTKTHHYELDELFGWDWWLLEDRPPEKEDEVSFVDFSIYLSWFYCLRALQLITHIPRENIKDRSLPASRDLVFLAEKGDSKIQQILKRIKDDSKRWQGILKPKDVNRIPDFIMLLEKAAEKQKELEADELIEKTLDKDKIEQFKNEVINEWKRAANLRNIIRAFGNFEILSITAPQGTLFYGRNVIEDKAAFIKDWHMHYPQWGESYGRHIAEIENVVVLSGIASKIRNFQPVKGPVDQIEKVLNKAVEKLSHESYEPNAVLVPDSWNVLYRIKQSPHFKDSDLEKSSSVGSYKGVRVFNLLGTETRGIYVLDLKKLGHWKQYKRKKMLHKEELMEGGIFTFYIEQYDEEKAKSLIEAHPEMFREPGTDKKLDEHSVIRKLLQQVNIRIFEQFRYEIKDKKAGFEILMSSE